MIEAKPYHKVILNRAAEDNPNNARVSTSKGKGYQECLDAGWIEEKTHPVSGYQYFSITAAGEAVLRAKPTARKPKRAPIGQLAPRLSDLAPRR